MLLPNVKLDTYVDVLLLDEIISPEVGSSFEELHELMASVRNIASTMYIEYFLFI